MTYPQQLTARLIDTDGATVVTIGGGNNPLERCFDLSFMDELNGPGTGSMSIPLSEAGAAEVEPGRFVQIFVDSIPRFTFMIEGDPEYTITGEGEETEAILTVTGRSWACIFDQSIVAPEHDLDLDLDSPWRLFSFASPSFPNDGAWAAADELYEYLDGVSVGVRYQTASDGLDYPSPISFPWPTSPLVYDPDSPPGASYEPTYWIWPTGEEEEAGWGFFRNTFTLSSPGIITFAVTGDNFWTFFLEGVPILGENEDHWIWRGWKEVSIGLPAGTFQVAAAVLNDTSSVAASPTNPAAFICDIFEYDPQQRAETLHLASDDTWDCVHSEENWPGWTPGQIIDKLLDESVARSELGAFDSVSFTDSTDSASNAWADIQDGSNQVPTFAADVGSTVMATFGKMHDEGHIDWHVRADYCILDAWSPSSLNDSSGVELAVGTNLRSLVRGPTDIYANRLLVQYERGYVWVPSTASSSEITAFGSVVSDIFASEAATEDEAVRQGQVELARRVATGYPAVVAEVEPTSAADAPYTGFALGETVEVPAVGGGTENIQALAFSCDQDEFGNALWTVELNRRWRSPVRRNSELLRQIGGRSGYATGRVG